MHTQPLYDRGMLPEVVFALVVVSIVGTLEPSSKVKSDLDKDLQKGEQALDTRIDALLHTTLEMSDKDPPVSEEEVYEELARTSGFTARAAPSSAHSEGTDLEMQTELSQCSDVPSVDWPDFFPPVYSSDDSASESFTPESTLVASEAYSEQSFTSNQSTLESTPVASEAYSEQSFTSNQSTLKSTLSASQVYRQQSSMSTQSTLESSLGSTRSTDVSFDPDPENP